MRVQRFFRGLRFKLTLSHAIVTAVALLVVTSVVVLLFFSRILIPNRLLTPDLWVSALSKGAAAPVLRHVLSEPHPDLELIELLMLSVDSTITDFTVAQLEDIEVYVRTLGEVQVLLFDPAGTLLGLSPGSVVAPSAVGEPISALDLPELEEIFQAALAGALEPEALVRELVRNESLVVAVPVKSADGEILGVSTVWISALPTETDLSDRFWAVANRGLLAFVLGAVITGSILGALVARRMVRRFRRVSEAAASWSQGDFTRFIDDRADDEIGDLGRGLNRMARQLRALIEERRNAAIVEERARLARDLHDSAKQLAFAASAQLAAADTLLEDGDLAGARSRFQEAQSLVDTVRRELADLILELRPADMASEGLASSLREFVATWSRQTGIPARTAIAAAVDVESREAEQLLRIAQEAMANTARHSQATAVAVKLETNAEGTVILSIMDDGCGFEVGSLEHGLGLQSMRERADLMGAVLTVESEVGTGTRVTVCCGDSGPSSNGPAALAT